MNSWIIPARAGFTRLASSPAGRPGDHPRSRGVYCSRSRGDAPDRGSSPLARGLLRERLGLPMKYGIIPARAGFTPPRPKPIWRRTDHPRSRGGYDESRLGGPHPLGSSPLARGLLGPLGPADISYGIIPARAGFTRSGTRRLVGPTDHPRSRGVYCCHQSAWTARPGSSPLARGLLANPRLPAPTEWIIPARAGFTPRARRGGPPAADHPRSRGVYLAKMAGLNVNSGSSPLARGSPVAGKPREIVGRIIPARAGFTRPGGRRG